MRQLRNRLIMGGLIGVAVVIALLLWADLRGVGARLSAFPILFVAPVVILSLFNYALRWLKWHYYLGVIGVKNISRADSASLWVAGFVLAISPGKVAELLKAVGLRFMTGTPTATGVPVVIAERVTDGLAMFVLAAIGLGGMFLGATGSQSIVTTYAPAYLTVLIALLAGIVIIQIKPLFMWIVGLIDRIPILRRFAESFRYLYHSAYQLFRPTPLTVAVGLGVISWAGECLGLFFILWGLGLTPTWTLFWQSTFILAASTILGGVSGLPGGLGAAEASIAFLLQTIVLASPDSALAGTATLLIRLSTLWFAVLLGLVAAFVFRARLFPLEMQVELDHPNVE